MYSVTLKVIIFTDKILKSARIAFLVSHLLHRASSYTTLSICVKINLQ